MNEVDPSIMNPRDIIALFEFPEEDEAHRERNIGLALAYIFGELFEIRHVLEETNTILNKVIIK